MQPVQTRPLYAYAGDSLTLQFTLEVGGVPTDYSDWVFSSMWRPTPADTREIVLTVDQTQKNVGIITVSASPVQTREMARRGVIDLQGVRGAEVRTFLWSPVNWTEDVTRIE